MAIIFIVLTVIFSVALFFMLATKFGSPKDRVSEILDLGSIPPSSKKETEPLLLDDEDQYV